MNIWEPKSCCCGASVKVGTQVIGWLRLIGSILSLLSYMKFAVIDYNGFVQICKEASDELHQPIDADLCATTSISIIAVCGVCSGLSIIIVSLLLAGANKNQPKLMLPYLVANFIEIVFFSIVAFIIFVLLFHAVNAGFAFIFIVLTGLALALEIYLFLVIHACYKEVKHHTECMGTDSNVPYMEKKDILYKI